MPRPMPMIFCRELLEEIADNPDEAAQEEPEKDGVELGEVKRRGVRAAIQPPHQREHGAKLAEGEGGHERERVHAADVGLAIGHIHGAPQGARADGRGDAPRGMRGRMAAAMHCAESEQDGRCNDGNCAQHHFGDAAAAGALQLAEEHAAPQQSEEGVGVPQRKGDSESDIADGKDGERVGHGPQRAGEQRPDDKVLLLAQVAEDVAGAFQQGGEGPASGKDAGDHPQRDGEGRKADVDQLGRSFGRAQPYAGRDSAGHAQAVKGMGILHGRRLILVASLS